jgi:hypothetical protein
MGSIKIAYVNIKLISLGINNFSSLAIWATVVFFKLLLFNLRRRIF